MPQFSGGGGAPPTPWYKENPFWGAQGLFVAFLLTGLGFGVSGHLTLGRWLLAGAWPCGVLAIWLALNGLVGSGSIRTGGRVAAVLGLAFYSRAQRCVDEFNRGNYEQWLDALYGGLQKKLEVDQNEKRSR